MLKHDIISLACVVSRDFIDAIVILILSSDFVAMGRRSVATKRKKRQRQKLRKKQKAQMKARKDAAVIPDPSILPQSPSTQSLGGFSSLGSPSTPPSPDSTFLDSQDECSPEEKMYSQTPTNQDSISEDETRSRKKSCILYGIDERVSSYIEDDKGNFKFDNGRYMTSDQLNVHLRRCNRDLASKADMYRKWFENSEAEIGELSVEHHRKLKRVRSFHQEKILNSNSRAATMLKKATRKWN